MRLPPDAPPHRERRDPGLHGRRSGKALAIYQRELVRTLLPRLQVDLSAPLVPSALFARPMREVRLEVGFGGGEHLIAAATRNPDIGFIGCEPFLNGMARAIAEIAAADVGNIRLHCGDAGDVFDRLPDASLARVYIFYPDPWPKRRQRKRRFVSDETLAKLARVMRPGAELRFATDIDDYCGWTLSRLMRAPSFAWTAERARDWQIPWTGWVETRYEAKAKREGRRGCYLTAVRQPPTS